MCSRRCLQTLNLYEGCQTKRCGIHPTLRSAGMRCMTMRPVLGSLRMRICSPACSPDSRTQALKVRPVT